MGHWRKRAGYLKGMGSAFARVGVCARARDGRGGGNSVGQPLLNIVPCKPSLSCRENKFGSENGLEIYRVKCRWES